MINRYSVSDISKIWSDENKYKTWLNVEVAICEAWNKLNIVPNDDLISIQSRASVDLVRMREIELETKHDVVAFTRMLSEIIGKEAKWIHLGITSTDVVDTAQNIMIKKSNQIVLNELLNFQKTLKQLALENEKTLIMGRTHGMYGEPTSLGLKFALWFDEIANQIERYKLASQQIEVAKVSGSMGNYANLELEIEEYVAQKFSLNLNNISTQVTQRDRHAFLVSVIANIASTLEKIATEIRLFQRSDVNEICEGFSAGQKGSSSMPHKKNPISSENISGLARYIRSYVGMTFENNNLWHERDISHSSNERIMFPDIFNTLVYSIRRMNDTLINLHINREEIQNHINEANNIYFSQRVLTFVLMKKQTVSREEIYDLIQECTAQCFATKTDFKEVLKNNNINKFLTNKELDDLFDVQFFLRQTHKIFTKVFKIKSDK
ncbi:adenylosuccinate lyase [Williamsoniiplasma somnilux]|uniref:Adenylosuccinate lyase n=1 Tax=Williamsoniiplasma somnilux TaxID=215578 RepID=A0A2K8P0M9_9MOLU|nr:adenylosuccinate lyase [Williamsoniiplasma somnilux]ATZ18453.1 adenylosuccinate lyase [Williamsoniiplasma somnilux]